MEKEVINDKEYWICKDNNIFQIEISNREDKFSEPWTKVYPDSNGSWKTNIYLSINGTQIKQFIFIQMDGGRIFVPLPKQKINKNKQVIYYWERDSLEYKIGKIIGEFYIYNSLEGIANKSDISII